MPFFCRFVLAEDALAVCIGRGKAKGMKKK